MRVLVASVPAVASVTRELALRAHTKSAQKRAAALQLLPSTSAAQLRDVLSVHAYDAAC